jgi:hypothetical protein
VGVHDVIGVSDELVQVRFDRRDPATVDRDIGALRTCRRDDGAAMDQEPGHFRRDLRPAHTARITTTITATRLAICEPSTP